MKLLGIEQVGPGSIGELQKALQDAVFDVIRARHPEWLDRSSPLYSGTLGPTISHATSVVANILWVLNILEE